MKKIALFALALAFLAPAAAEAACDGVPAANQVCASPPGGAGPMQPRTLSATHLPLITLSKGGTGVALTDPNADRIFFWDDSAGATDWLQLGTGLSITATTLNIDTELQAIAGLTSAADKLPYFTGSGTAALADFTSFGRTLAALADAAALRTAAGLVIGTNVQAFDADLATLAAPTAWRLFYSNGSSAITELALGADGTVLTFNGTTSAPTAAAVSLSADVSGDLPFANLVQSSAGFSVVGKASTGAGDFAEITCSADQVLRRSGSGDIACGTLVTNNYAASSVTYAKIQDVSATDRILGRDTAGAGVIEELTVSGGLEFTGTGIQRSALTGDVTASAGSGSTTIAANAVALSTDTTGNYMADVSAGTGIATTHTPAEGSTATIAFDFSDAGASPSLGANETRFSGGAAGAIVAEGATPDAFESRILFTDPTADRVLTIPNADSNPVQPLTCTGSDKVSAISAAGVVTCSPDAGAGAGISNVVEDLTPQLGGDLDPNTFGVTAAWSPASSDGAALGTTSKMWSDLFLASGGVIDFNNGNCTITHSAALITYSCATSFGTSNPVTLGTIELGAASDTTISRASAGVAAVEGQNILTAATGQPLDSDLTALAGNSTNGMWARTGSGTGSARTITGSNGVSVTNGDGVSGAPAIAGTTATTAAYGVVKIGTEVREKLSANRTYYVGSDQGTATISNASPAVVTDTSHGLSADDPVVFNTTGALPTGLTIGVAYYVKTVLDANTFTVAATVGGAAINTSSAGSGTHSYYTGNNNNAGLSTGRAGAFLTIDKALTTIARTIDAGNYQLTISIDDGLFLEAVHWVTTLPGQNGHDGVKLSGAGATTVIDGNGSVPISVQEATARLKIENLKLQTTNNNLLEARYGGTVIMGAGITFGAAGSGAHFNLGEGGLILVESAYTIAAAAAYHVTNADNSRLMFSTSGITATFSASMNFSGSFIYTARGAFTRVGNATWTLGGNTITGKRYDVQSIGVIDTFGQATTWLPGSTAGTGTNPGASPYGLYNRRRKPGRRPPNRSDRSVRRPQRGLRMAA